MSHRWRREELRYACLMCDGFKYQEAYLRGNPIALEVTNLSQAAVDGMCDYGLSR